MSLEHLMKFASDLRSHAGVENSLRRCGGRAALKIGNVEFLFDQEGRYLGRGETMKRELDDLIERCDPEVLESKLNRE